MCRMFSHLPAEQFAYETRSIRISGHSTSIRLEHMFWKVLEDMAAQENVSVARFVTTLHDEALAFHGHIHNVASLLRCSCVTYLAIQPAAREAAAGWLMAAAE